MELFTYDKGLDVSLYQVLVDMEEGKEPCNHKIKGKRNRLTQKNLEREIFIRRNKKYL